MMAQTLTKAICSDHLTIQPQGQKAHLLGQILRVRNAGHRAESGSLYYGGTGAGCDDCLAQSCQ